MGGRLERFVTLSSCAAVVAALSVSALPAQAAPVQLARSHPHPAAPLITGVAGRGLGILVDWAPASVSEGVKSYELTAPPVVRNGEPASCRRVVRANAPGDSTMTIVTGVCAHVAYRVTISANTSSGPTAPSRPSDPVVPLPATAPFVPLVTSVLGRDHSLDVRWARPAYDGGRPLSGFVLTAASLLGSKTLRLGASSTGASMTGLHNGTSYHVDLWAENVVGKSPAATGRGTPSPPHAPGAPSDLSVVPGAGRGTMDISWAAPVDDGGYPVTGYRLSLRQEVAVAKGKAVAFRAAPGAKAVTRTVRSTTVAVRGLSEALVFYVFRVAAITRAGTSMPTPWSGPVTLRTAAKPVTKVLPASVLSELRSYSEGTLTWAYPSPSEVPAALRSLKAGDVLVGGISRLTPQGLLRKVLSVDIANPATFVVSTAPAALSSAFTTLTADVSLGPTTPGPAVIATGAGRFIPATPGIAVSALPDPGISTTLTLSLDYSAEVDNAQSTEAASLDVEGEVDLTPSLDMEATLLQGLAGIPDGADLSFTASLGVTQAETISASGTLEQQWGLGPGLGVYPPATPDFAPQAGDYCYGTFVVALGLVPLVLTPCVEINVTLSATGELGVTTSTTFLYGEEANWSSTDPDVLTLTNLSQAPSTSGPPTTSLLAQVEGSLGLDVKPELFLYGVTGPYIDASITLVADVSPTAQPWFTLGLQLGVAAGWQVVIDFLGIDRQVQAVASASWQLYQSTGAPPVSLVLPLTVSPSTATVPPGGSEQFSAPGASGTVTWSLSGDAGDQITNSGLFTAAAPAGRQVVVTATDSRGATGTAVVAVGTGIGPPQDLAGTVNATGTGAVLTWTPPLAVSGETIASYSVSTSPVTTVVSVAGTATGASITSLLPGTTYVVSISAWTASGFESAPATVLLTTPTTPTSTPPGTGLTWTAPNHVAPLVFSSVSCASDTFCVAAGTQAGGPPLSIPAFAVVWDHGSWSAPHRLPQFVDADQVAGVACPLEGVCVVVEAAGIAFWVRDGVWSQPQTIGGPANNPGGSTQFVGVSCATPAFCVAALSNGTVVMWNGTSWSQPRPVATVASAISCPTTTFCAVVGSAYPSQSAAAFFNGSTWTSVATNLGTGLPALSCPSASYCMAVGGFHASGDVSATFDGSTWSKLSMAPAIGAEGFINVSCAGPSFCVAIDGGGGQNGYPSSYRDRAAFLWDGQSWSAPMLIDQTGGLAGGLTSVSCPSATFCMAVDTGGNAVQLLP